MWIANLRFYVDYFWITVTIKAATKLEKIQHDGALETKMVKDTNEKLGRTRIKYEVTENLGSSKRQLTIWSNQISEHWTVLQYFIANGILLNNTENK